MVPQLSQKIHHSSGRILPICYRLAKLQLRCQLFYEEVRLVDVHVGPPQQIHQADIQVFIVGGLPGDLVLELQAPDRIVLTARVILITLKSR